MFIYNFFYFILTARALKISTVRVKIKTKSFNDLILCRFLHPDRLFYLISSLSLGNTQLDL